MKQSECEARESQTDQNEIHHPMGVQERGLEEIEFIGLVRMIVSGMGKQQGGQKASDDADQTGGEAKPKGELE